MIIIGQNLDEDEKELEDQEIEAQINRLKKGKGGGRDLLANEAWMYSSGKASRNLKEVVKRV